MVLKIWSLVIVLLLIMPCLGVVHGENPTFSYVDGVLKLNPSTTAPILPTTSTTAPTLPKDPNENTLSTTPSTNMPPSIEDRSGSQNPTFSYVDGVLKLNPPTKTLTLPKEPNENTLSKIPTPAVYKEGRPNLIIGGIRQDSSNPEENTKYTKFADNNNAAYVPTYYSGQSKDGIDENLKRLGDGMQVAYAAYSIPSSENGLSSPALNEKPYTTIISYSGGTASAVAALDKQGVTCDTLILVSPMKALLFETDYQKAIKRILDENKVKNIIVLWSPKDEPTGGVDFYQAENYLFGGDTRITVNEVPLTKADEDAHGEILDYAIQNINDGVYTDPQAQCVAKPNQLSGTQFPAWMDSKSKTASGLESWGKHPKGWGVSQAYVNAHPEIYGYPSPTPSSPQSGSNSGSSGSSTPDTSWIEEMIKREMADENSQLVQDLQANVNK